MSTIVADNLRNVHSNIKLACEKSGRDVSEITLISVSKTKPVDMLKEAYDTGERCFGENKVQEICQKYPEMPEDVKWHMIGHLQTNKVKQVIDKVVLIHSVDSIKLAEVISRESEKKGIVTDILVEVNVANEDTKFGTTYENVEALIMDIASLPAVKVRGLMTIAPFVDNPEDNRVIFRKLNQLFVDLRAKNIDNTYMDILSMGMTNDYQVAIEEGATMIRVGTGIFGNRNYI